MSQTNKIIIYCTILAALLGYNFYEFKYNMSIGVGHAYTAKSLALSYNFNVDEYWGNAGVDVIDYNNHKYTAYAPFNSVLMAIAYFVLQIFYYLYTNVIGPINGVVSAILESLFLRIPSLVAYAGIAVLIDRFLRKYNVDDFVRRIVIIGLLLGTILFNYSLSFFNHSLAAFFIFTAYFLIDRSKSRLDYFCSGILVGAAFLAEFPTGIFAIAVFVFLTYLLLKKQIDIRSYLTRLLAFAGPILTAIILLGFFNYYHFGSPLKMSEQILFEQKSLIGTQHSFSQNPMYGLWGLYFSPLKGLFLISPFLLFALIGFKKFWVVKRSSALFGIVYISLVSIVYSMWPDCFGATPFGPRYLISVIPFLAFYSAFGITKKIGYRIYLILVIYAVYICIMNALDGLPSGTWFGMDRCNTLEYASLFKANSYFRLLINGNFHLAPYLLRNLIL